MHERGRRGEETRNAVAEERGAGKARKGGERRKDNGRRERGGKEREGRECKDRGNKRSTEMHLSNWEQVTGRTQISFSVCGSRRGRTGVGTKRAVPYPGDQRSEVVRTRTGAEAARGLLRG